MRRVHLRGSQNIRKRLLILGPAGYLGLLMCALFRAGRPRALDRSHAHRLGAVKRDPIAPDAWGLTRIYCDLRTFFRRTLSLAMAAGLVTTRGRSDRVPLVL